MASDRRPYDAARRARARAFLIEINARTVCAHCGAQPVDWHNPDHVNLNRQNRRVGRLTSAGASNAEIEKEIAICTPLCRRCHMVEDGRLRNLERKRKRFLGSQQHAAKLTEETVVEIRRLRAEGRTAVSLSAQYGVTPSAICHVALRRTWRHVD